MDDHEVLRWEGRTGAVWMFVDTFGRVRDVRMVGGGRRRRISYSPTRGSGAPLVTTHVTAGVEMAPHMPASPENAGRALRYDWEWWADNQDEMTERFSSWLAR